MIRFAVVGTSRITEKFLAALASFPDVSVQAVCSRSKERGKAFADKNHLERVYLSTQALAADPAIDAVYISSPNALHCSQTLQMLNAGKHVLCEKTLGSNYAEEKKMFDCAEKNGVLLQEAMRTIHDPGYAVVKENLHRLGKLRRVSLRYCQYSSRYDSYKAGDHQNIFDPALSGGALMDIGVYCVEFLVGLFGAPKGIKASSVLLESGVDGTGTILAEYEDLIAEIVYSKITESEVPSEIQGERGSLIIPFLSNPGGLSIRSIDGTTELLPESNFPNRKEQISSSGPSNLEYELQTFVQAVQQHKTLDAFRDVSLTSIRIMDEVRAQCGIHFPADGGNDLTNPQIRAMI